MAPDSIRKRWGVARWAIPISVLAPGIAYAQDLKTSALAGAAPLTIAVGAGAFAVLAVGMVRAMNADSKRRERRASEQIAGMRALVDEYEALLSGTREVTIFWPEHGDGPKVLGQAVAILPPGRRADAVLKFSTWLDFDDAERLARLVEGLRVDGRAFDTSLRTHDGRDLRVAGWVLGGGAALRLRPARPAISSSPAAIAGTDLRAVLGLLSRPAYMRGTNGRLEYANAAYLGLADAYGVTGTEAAPPELLDRKQQQECRAALAGNDARAVLDLDLAGEGRYELVETPLTSGSAGYLRQVAPSVSDAAALGIEAIAGFIDVLTTPIAIFGPDKQLVQYNRGYARLWPLEKEFLELGLDERAILDKLRTDGVLPAVTDYHAWRKQHLDAYALKAPREESWHLQDGRTVKVIAAPAGSRGGVIYIFEDITARLELESTNRALSSVQRESLNALSEAVAVFGTNGRLTLSNPRLVALWQLPVVELGQHPHIDKIAEACGRSMPEDGLSIWRDLKRGIIDLNPARSDTTGRIARSDGRLLDYAITRLPDGQTMMTFIDVTESANYSRVLKERNEALIAADKLKDAFIQNVSYELRSPLTNIIGFADLLAADGAELSERQRSYTDYIRASSVTLGVLIDNILDLANVDAGIAELNPEEQDVEALVEKARAGLTATLPELGGDKSVNLRIDIADVLPPFVADGTRMVQILYNLLSNAARFSPPGGEISLTVSARAERMLFVIEDEGPGLTDEMREVIHARIDAPTAGGRQRGAGLGLAIVRTFVNLHGGTITAERREPRGSRIIVNLPRDSALAGVAE